MVSSLRDVASTVCAWCSRSRSRAKKPKSLSFLNVPPQRSPKLLACVVGMRLSCGARAAGILLIRVQIGGAEIAEERAVKEVRARLGNHIDRRALRASIHG